MAEEQLQGELIGAQLRHMVDLIKMDLDAEREARKRDREFFLYRIEQLESARNDHETRLRSVTDGVTTFKTWSGLASGGSSLMSIVALVKAFFGA